jgi:hypothetical protein
MPPSNDNIANAVTLTVGSSGTVTGTTIGATSEGNGSTGDEQWWYGLDEPTVWYKFTTGAQAVDFDIDISGDFNVTVHTYYAISGEPPFNFLDRSLSYFAGDGTNDPPAKTFRVAPEITFYLTVHSWGGDGSSGNFSFDWSLTELSPSNNDSFFGATRLTAAEGTISVDVRDYTIETFDGGEENLTNSDDGTAWYYFKNEDSFNRRLIVKSHYWENINAGAEVYTNINEPLIYVVGGGVGFLGTNHQAPNLGSGVYTILIPPGYTAWVRIIGDSTPIPDAPNIGTFDYTWGRNYRVQAADDANEPHADVSVVSGIVQTTQDLKFQQATNPTDETETFYVRGAALPPNGEYQLVIRAKISGGFLRFINIKRGDVFPGKIYCDYGKINTSYREVPLTYRDGIDSSWGSGDFQSIRFRVLPKLIVNGEDLTFYCIPTSSATFFIDYVDFVQINTSTTTSRTSYELIDDGWLGNEVDGSIPKTGVVLQRASTTPDIVVLDDGRIFASTVEESTNARCNYGPILWELVGGTTWTKVAGPLSDHVYTFYTAGSAKISPCHLATDGIDVWIAWAESEQAGTDTGNGPHKIRVKKYDVSAGTTSFVGSSSGIEFDPNYQQAKFSEFTFVVSRHDASSDASMPYIAAWPYFTSGGQDRLFVMKWNGSSWVNINPPNPASGSWNSDYWSISFIEPGNFNIGLTFCHHDGLSDHPSLFTVATHDVPPHTSDEVIFYYSEYNGSGWSTPLVWHAIDWNNAGIDFPYKNTTTIGSTNVYATAQGCWLGNDGQRPIALIQVWENPTTYVHNPIIVAKLNATGDGWEPYQGDPCQIEDWDSWTPMYVKTKNGKEFVSLMTFNVNGDYTITQYKPGNPEQPWVYAPNDGAIIGSDFTPFLRGFENNLYLCIDGFNVNFGEEWVPRIRKYTALSEGPLIFNEVVPLR